MGNRVDQGRNLALDITKAFGIIFMVLVHMHFSDDIFGVYIHAFDMQLFFIVSGLLFNEKKTVGQTLSSRARALLIPYLFFGGLYGTVYIIVKLVSHDTASIVPALKVILLFPTEKFPYESALWFLPVMFLTSVGYAVIRKYLDLPKATAVVLIIGTIGFTFPFLTDIRLPWGIDSALTAILYFHFGCLMKHFSLLEKIKKLKRNKPFVYWPGFAAVAAANIVLIFLNGEVNMRAIQYGNPVLSFVNAAVGTIVWIVVSESVVSCGNINRIKSVLCDISRLSLIFVCTNHITIRAGGAVLKKGFGLLGIKAQPVYYAAVFILSMTVMLLAGKIIDRTKLKVLIGRK